MIEPRYQRRDTPPAPQPDAQDDASRIATALSRGVERTNDQTRRTAALLCLTGLLWGWILTWYPVSADRSGAEIAALRAGVTGEEPPWRRTNDGWEPAWWLVRPKTFHYPSLHPLWLFAGQVLSCAVVALTENRKPRGTEVSARPQPRSD